ncbi:MAG: response regulator [Pedobacter sp.]|nr:MAG: response regulator [Pedobacter sp.]
MFISRLRKRLNNTSISRKLYFTIGFTALLVIVELCTLWFSITTLSAVRSYVGGEGLWSKAQKDAILSLREYAYSHKEADYLAFQKYLEVPYGDKKGRIELEKSNPDYTKFTEQESIAVSAKTYRQDDNTMTIEFKVRDTGIGILKEKQSKIFDLFEQASNDMTRKFGGTGIGLSIVKHLVALQHGEISVSSIPGEGSEFCFRLPFLLKHNDEINPLPPVSSLNSTSVSLSYGRGISVLIVEDNAINQLLVLKLLHKHGYETTVAENGKVAIEKYKSHSFDIILMDLQMPEMDGYETTINIRNMDAEKRNVPIVAMTAHTITGDYEKCMAIGINEYISKPFHPDELYQKIQLLVTQRS